MESITRVKPVTFVGSGLLIFLSVAAVLAAFIYGRKKLKGPIGPFFIGFAAFALFALVLESIMHNLVLLVSPVGEKIQGNIWLYALYGGAAAAVFEETGRIVAAKTVLRRRQDTVSAYMYGAGHGGIEALAVGAATGVSNIVLGVMINSGTYRALLEPLSGANLDAAVAQLSALCADNGASLLGGVERVFALAVHIALSLIMFRGLREHKGGLVVLCYALHFLLDAVLVVINSYFGIYIAELWVAVCAALIVLLALKISPLPKGGEQESAA